MTITTLSFKTVFWCNFSQVARFGCMLKEESASAVQGNSIRRCIFGEGFDLFSPFNRFIGIRLPVVYSFGLRSSVRRQLMQSG